MIVIKFCYKLLSTMLYISVENTSSVSATQDMVSYEDIRRANIHCIMKLLSYAALH